MKKIILVIGIILTIISGVGIFLWKTVAHCQLIGGNVSGSFEYVSGALVPACKNPESGTWKVEGVKCDCVCCLDTSSLQYAVYKFFK